ncbi:MAG: DUF4249 domain-containing protein, partial [Bacteroidia bacterium]|nr:DUF4249 domain-containing protein [Bacteroidia bacterium]
MKSPNRNLLIGAILAFVLGLAACEQPLLYELDDYEAKWVLQGELIAREIPEVYITESETFYTYVARTILPTFVEDATVILVGNGLIDTLRSFSRVDTLRSNSVLDTVVQTVWGYRGTQKIVEGEQYSIEITGDGNLLTAETTVPRKGSLANFAVDTSGSLSTSGYI